MAGQLVPFLGPGGVITYLQPDNPLVAGGSNLPGAGGSNLGLFASPTPGGGPALGGMCVSPDGTQTANPSQNGSCPPGWTLGPTPGGQRDPFGQGTAGAVPAGPPNLISGNNSPGQFIGNAVAGLTSPLDFLNRLWKVLSNPDYWKGVGLILAGGVLVVVGLFLYGRGGTPVIVRTKVIERQARREAPSEGEEDDAA